MRVLSIDPGPHTGWVLFDTLDQSLEYGTIEGSVVDIGLRLDGLIDSVAKSFPDSPTGHVVCENFFISGPRAVEANHTIELIGIARWLARTRGTTFTLQSPADARQFATDEKLRAMGWEWGSNHSKSACRHLLLFLIKARILGPADLAIQSAPDTEGGPVAGR